MMDWVDHCLVQGPTQRLWCPQMRCFISMLECLPGKGPPSTFARGRLHVSAAPQTYKLQTCIDHSENLFPADRRSGAAWRRIHDLRCFVKSVFLILSLFGGHEILPGVPCAAASELQARALSCWLSQAMTPRRVRTLQTIHNFTNSCYKYLHLGRSKCTSEPAHELLRSSSCASLRAPSPQGRVASKLQWFIVVLSGPYEWPCW